MSDSKDSWINRVTKGNKEIDISFVSKETGKELFRMGLIKDYSKDDICPRVNDEKTYKFVVEDGLNPLDFQYINPKSKNPLYFHSLKRSPLMTYPCSRCKHLSSEGVSNPESTGIMSVLRYRCDEYGGVRIAVGLAKGKHVTFSKEQLEKLLEEKTSNLF